MTERLVCESKVTAVTVYARGAVVTRQVTIPELPSEAVELVIKGITPFAASGSFRAASDHTRAVLGITSALEFPEQRETPSELEEKLRVEQRALELLEARAEFVAGRRIGLSQVDTDVGMFARSVRYDAASRLSDGLAISAMIDGNVVSLDDALLELQDQIEAQKRVVAATMVELDQASTANQTMGHKPTRCAVARLASGDGGPTSIELSYIVRAARWWPAYTVRVDSKSSDVHWRMEALIAQQSGEDWEGVDVQLATADLAREVQLPELQSWRLGRRQPSKPAGFRALPEDLETLFAGYDRAHQRSLGVRKAAYEPEYEPEPVYGAGEVLQTGTFALSELDQPNAKHAANQAMLDDYEMPMLEAAAVMPQHMPRSMAKKSSGIGGLVAAPFAAAAAPFAAAAGAISSLASNSPGRGGGGGAGAVEVPSPIDPDDAWLDFDRLELAGPDGHRRGKLSVRSEEVGGEYDAISHVQGLQGPTYSADPVGPGQFDHIYPGNVQVDVPSDGELHRVDVLSADTTYQPRFRTVPVVSTEVFREVRLRNPFEAPILAGPADVFVGGAMLTTSAIEAVDRGGMVTVGLGLEDRLRVTRKVRAEEHEAGLFGGKTVVDHDIEVEVVSSLGHEAHIEVLDRLPVTYDDDVDVESIDENPVGDEYEEFVDGRTVRGGRIWGLMVPAGETRTIEYKFRIKLPSKREIVGGNRRE